MILVQASAYIKSKQAFNPYTLTIILPEKRQGGSYMGPVHVRRALRLLFAVLVFALSCLLLFYVTKIAYPFIIGLFLAFLINPAVDFLQYKFRFPRALAVLVTMAAIAMLFAGLIALLIAEIMAGANYLSHIIPKNLDTFVAYWKTFVESHIVPIYDQLAALFRNLDGGQQKTLMENIENAGNSIATSAGDFIRDFFQRIPALVAWFPNAATAFIFSSLATFLISNDWPRFKGYIHAFIPKKIKNSGISVFFELKRALSGFFKAQFILISITVVIVLIGLLVLRIEYAITIALVIGMVDIIPYLGSGTVFIPWILYELMAGNANLAIGLGILYFIIVIQRQVMEPKVLSSSIGLDPLATLLSLFIGYKLFGFLGLAAGPIVLVIINALHRTRVFHDIWDYIK